MKKTLMLTGMVLLGLMVLAVPVIYFGGQIYYGNHKEPAQEQARQYAKDMGYDISGVSCTNNDTDGDSYVSCSLRLKDGTKENLQCVGAVPFWNLTGNKGCKDIPKIHTTNR